MGFGIVIFPLDWRFDVWSRAKKSMIAIGPIRLVWHKQPGEWKPVR